MTPNNQTQYEQDMEICRAATDGPWKMDMVPTNLGWKLEDWPFNSEDAEYIAHFNPQRVRQILERQRRLEERIKELESDKERVKVKEFTFHKELLSNE